MKILVLSDSHSGLSFMRKCIRGVRPDAIVHLGDYLEDAQVLAEEFPHIPLHAVPGNCDSFRMLVREPWTRCYDVCGVRLYMTHGHIHCVKSGTDRLLAEAQRAGATAVLYGHTHVPECRKLPEGMWVLNPGSCAHFGGSCGIVETEANTILTCRILYAADLEESI